MDFREAGLRTGGVEDWIRVIKTGFVISSGEPLDPTATTLNKLDKIFGKHYVLFTHYLPQELWKTIKTLLFHASETQWKIPCL
jgi:hypothetical protein